MKSPLSISILKLAGTAFVAVFLTLISVAAYAGNVTYSISESTTQTVTQASDSQPFNFTVQSPVLPATTGTSQTPYETEVCDSQPGVHAQYLVKDMNYTYTDGVTLEPVTVPFDFSSWVAFVPQYKCFTAADQNDQVSATVSVPGVAAIGMYTAKIVAKAANGIGWGEGAGIHITLIVIAPTSGDSTPPVVTILQPALDNGQPQHFELGDRIPVNFTAVDLESPVSAWTASLNPGAIDLAGLMNESAITNGLEATGDILSAVPGGDETIHAIGEYNLQVTATSDGGTSAPATRYFTVNYSIDPMAPDITQDPLVVSKKIKNGNCSGGGLQIKFNAAAVQPADTVDTDNAGEKFVRDTSVVVKIFLDGNSTPEVTRIYDGNSNNTAVEIDGDTGDALSNTKYFTKVDFCTETAPTGNYTIKVYFNDHSGNPYLQYSKTFVLQ